MEALVLVVVVIALVVVVALVAGAGVFLARRRRGDHPVVTEPPQPDPVARHTVSEPAPMSDLESALARVTDSSGRPIRDRIDAEAGHVDELRVPDDTGPLLRRALDHVANPAHQPDDDPPLAGAPDDAADASEA